VGEGGKGVNGAVKKGAKGEVGEVGCCKFTMFAVGGRRRHIGWKKIEIGT
jgi:hypothetical protein